MIKRIVNLLFYKKVKEVKRVKTGEDVYFDLFQKFKKKNNINKAVIIKHKRHCLLRESVSKWLNYYTIDDYVCDDSDRVNIFIFNSTFDRLRFEYHISSLEYFTLLDRDTLKAKYDDALEYWFNNSNYTP